MSNAPKVTPNMAIEIIVRGAAAGLSFYLEGEPGVGKSAIAAEVARRLNRKLVDRRANNWSPDDAAGTRMQDMATRKTVWFPPEWLPNVDGSVEGKNADGKDFEGTVLFFDELASADDRVRKPLFGVLLERRMNDIYLPDNTVVIAAGNESATGTMVFELDNATRTRFVTLKIVADLSSWLIDFAPDNIASASVVAYLKLNMHHFCMTEEALQKGLDLYPNPRNWEHVSILEEAYGTGEDAREAFSHAVQGKLGTEVGTEFIALFDNVAQMANLKDLLDASPEKRKDLWPKTLGQMYALSYSMMCFPSDLAGGKKIMDLLDTIPADTSDLPFSEMKVPVREVIMKRLRAGGVKQADLDKVFGAGSREDVKAILGNGPLIKIAA